MMAQLLMGRGPAPLRRAMASAARNGSDSIRVESGFVSAGWCIGLAAFTAGYCFGRVQGTSEAERHRDKEMRAWEKSQQAQLEAAIASTHAHIDAHNAEVAELLARAGQWEPYQDFMKDKQDARQKHRDSK